VLAGRDGWRSQSVRRRLREVVRLANEVFVRLKSAYEAASEELLRRVDAGSAQGVQS